MGHPEALPSVARDRAGTVRLVVILGGLAAFAPLSFDMYLPAFPQLATDFGASASAIQLTLTACLVGLAVGQLVFGSLSDARGRRGAAPRRPRASTRSPPRCARSRPTR